MFISHRSTATALFYCVAIIFTFISFNIPGVQAKQVSQVAPFTKEELLADVNLVRHEAGLPELLAQTDLETAAKLKRQYMTINKYFNHWSPDRAVSPWSFLNLAGYKFRHAGENLALHYTSSEAVVEAMMASPKHRDNLLGAQYQDIGIDVYTGQYEGVNSTMVVMYFGAQLE